MRTVKTEAVRWLIVCGMSLLLPMNGHALAARVRFDLDGAIRTGDFKAYYANLSAWLSQKVPADPGQISPKTMKALLRDPVFVAALAQRQFIARVWGSLPGIENLGAFAKAGPKNKEFLAWLMRKPAVMDTVLLTRTPSAMFAREDNSWSINAQTLDTWKKIYYADPDSRQGLYLRLAIATALRPPGTGNRGVGMQKKPSDPLVRYMHFKKAHQNQELVPSFDNLTAWELTHVVSSCASEKDLAWGREMVHTFIPDLLKGEQVVSITSQMRYQGSQIPYNDFSCVLAGGGKCGPRSSFGVFINQAFGIPAIGVGQPGHAAVAYRASNGTWQIRYGRGWNVSKLFDRFKMSGAEFLERVKERSGPTFAQVEHLRWLASTLASKQQAAAVMEAARKIQKATPELNVIPRNAKPDETSVLRAFEAPRNAADGYSARVRGFLYPPRTGQYVFGITSDDKADLFLSTDADPKNQELIAYLREWAEPGQFDKFPTQKSEPIQLVGGKKYYIEAVHKELTSGDHLTVAWSGPGATWGVIRGANLSPYPSGVKGSIVREVWRDKSAPPQKPPVTKPAPPIQVAPGVIHVEAEKFFTRGGVHFYGGQHPSVPVIDCYTGGKQLHFQALMGEAHVGYKINVPKTGIYELTTRVATVNWGQNLYVRSFGAMLPVKKATASAVYHNMVKDLGPQQAADNDLGTRWAVNEGVDEAWLELDLGRPTTISTVMIDERTWNRVSKFQVEYKVGNNWKTIFEGTNIGIGFAKDFNPVTARYVRLHTLDCRQAGGPTIWEFNVGTVNDGSAWIHCPWTRGLWQTTKPVNIRLVKGPRTLWFCAPYQRGISFKWFELKPKGIRRGTTSISRTSQVKNP